MSAVKKATPVCCGATLLLACTVSARAGGVLRVDDDAPLGGDGATWASAFRFLQDALAVAAEPGSGIGEIRVAQGLYRPDRDQNSASGSGDREAAFGLLSGVAIRGGWAGLGAPDPDARDVALYETVLSGDLLGDDGADFLGSEENSFHVVVALDVDDTAGLDGVTVRGGRADGPNFGPTPESQDQGSGVNVYFSTPLLVNCTFAQQLVRQPRRGQRPRRINARGLHVSRQLVGQPRGRPLHA